METSSESRWWDLPAASLLLVAMLTAATRLVATGWTDYLSIVQTIAVLGTIAGLALGQSRFAPRLAGLFAIAYGLFIVPWQLGNTVRGNLPWSTRLLILVNRLDVIIHQLIKQEVVQDSLLFIVLMSALFWLLSVYAGYTLTRYGDAWRAILPAGLALFVIHSFDALIARRALYLAVYLFFSLVLVARIVYLQQHTRWQQSRTALPPHLGLDFIRFTLLATTLLVLFAWSAPALASTVPVAEKAFQQIKQPWNEIRDHMDNAFASLRSSVGMVSDYYGSSVLLGRGNRLTDSQVFAVKVPSDPPEGIRYYWRARTYDTYLDGQWLSTASTSRSFNPTNFNLSLSNENARWIADFDFITNSPVSTLFSPPQPIWVSRQSQVEVANNSDGTVDISAFRATPSMGSGEVYQTRSSLSSATEAQMREAGTNYPEWITERYLQLPDSITPRTRQLAHDLTNGLKTPYDKVVAVTNYLRNNITYSETVPNQPSDQESIDWFLFDLKKGFCNYYASAEVVLLRAAGIPARWSVGYAQGERLDPTTYIVRQRDAHAWPEIFFPGLGWVEFEPTASQPVLVRLPGQPGAGDVSGAGNPTIDEEARLRAQQEAERALELAREGGGVAGGSLPSNSPYRILYWAAPLMLGALLLFIAFRLRDRINVSAAPIAMERTMLKIGIRPPKLLSLWARQAALPPFAKAYLEINRALSRLGKRPNLTDTPTERAADLAELLPPAKIPAQKLVSEYQVATFSTQPADLETARKSGQEIRSLSFKALLRRLLARFQRSSGSTFNPWQSRQH